MSGPTPAAASATAAAGTTLLPPYHARIESDWIDYNGHLRDAYYALVLSYAIDDVMDHLGLHAEYRERTHCTLYTLEMHMHYLHEVKGTDTLTVSTSILDADAKRLHVGCRFEIESPDAGSVTVATGDAMLLHVHQGEKPASMAFPPEVGARIEELKLSPVDSAAWGPRSRKLELKRRGAA